MNPFPFELLNALDSDVEIIVKPKTKEEKSATTHVLQVAFSQTSC